MYTRITSHFNEPVQIGKDNSQRSQNEKIYDAHYWEYQKKMNEFGAAVKGDVIRFLCSGDFILNRVLEFGCSGGYILNSVGTNPVERYGIEINPESRAYALSNFPGIREVYSRLDDAVAAKLSFDVIFTTSVLEHVDCPLCVLRQMKSLLKPGGILIVGLKNDGADSRQLFPRYGHEPNHHIYTWNALLLANMLDSAGYTPCNVVSQFDAWHEINVTKYKEDRVKYCQIGLKQGEKNEVNNLWSVSVLTQDSALCTKYKAKVEQLRNCEYLMT